MKKEFFGDDLQDALSKASQKLGIDKDKISYSVIDGIFGSSLTGEKTAILAEYEKTEKKNGLPEESAAFLKEFEKIREDTDAGASFILEKIISAIGYEVNISRVEKDDLVLLSVDFQGEKPDTRKGEIRELRGAAQYIINRVAGDGREKSKRYIVDFNGDLEERKKKMEEIADELSSFVKSQKQPVQLELMDSQDRRLLHLALEDEREINTYSQGEGRFRVLCMEPKKTDKKAESS